jgi:hypothetical protein
VLGDIDEVHRRFVWLPHPPASAREPGLLYFYEDGVLAWKSTCILALSEVVEPLQRAWTMLTTLCLGFGLLHF